MLRSFSCLLVVLASVSPAAAQSAGISIPEPTDGALFALGVVGLIVGRRIAKRRG
ncbi:MAG: PEP-CTERM sorting domain-containing protein [Novosphingobium sp.]